MTDISKAARLKRIASVAVQCFDEADWKLLETNLPGGNMIPQHERLFRSMYFGDDDYAYCVAEVLQTLVSYRPNNLEALERYIAEAHGNALRTDADIIPTEEKNCPCQLFISHKAEEKGFASALKGALTPYGIESFVAHQDIQVTLEWEREIERVLKKCDAFVYLASPASNSSAWCQQEIGWAFGRDIPMISVSLYADPVAFLGARQSLHVSSYFDPDVVAKSVFDALATDPRVSQRIADGIIDNLASSTRFDDSNWYAERLNAVPSLTSSQAERIEQAIENNSQVGNANHGTLPDYLRNLISCKMK